MSESNSTIDEFKNLIRECGIDGALEKVDLDNIHYSENFTESHLSDPIFSEPRVTVKKSIDTKLLKIETQSSETEKIVLENINDKPLVTSTNKMYFIDSIQVSIESSTEMESDIIRPNVMTQST